MTGDKAAEQSAAQQALQARHAWGMPVAAAPVLAQAPPKQAGPELACPKSDLVMFLQGYTKKAMSKNDVTYAVTQQDGLAQAILTVGPMEGQQFAGEPCATVKE